MPRDSLEWLQMHFHDWYFLCLVVFAPLVFWIANRAPGSVQFSSLSFVDQSPKSLRSRLAVVPALLFTAAFVLLTIALAGYRSPKSETKVSREGIAMMMVVDRSSSMQARDLVKDDMSVNRLDVVKDVFRDFVLGEEGAGGGRESDLIGLIAFAGYADSLCPLTLDHANLSLMVDELEIVDRRDEDGTAIGDGVALAVERLRKSKAKSKVIILLTDGMNTAGSIEPLRAAELAQDHDMRIYAIGAGTKGTAPVPAIDPFSGREVLRRAIVQIDERSLQSMADATGGKYFRATDADALTSIYAEIDRLEKTEVSEVRYLQYEEHYAKFVWASLACIVLASLLAGTVFRRLP